MERYKIINHKPVCSFFLLSIDQQTRDVHRDWKAAAAAAAALRWPINLPLPRQHRHVHLCKLIPIINQMPYLSHWFICSINCTYINRERTQFSYVYLYHQIQRIKIVFNERRTRLTKNWIEYVRFFFSNDRTNYRFFYFSLG